MKKDCLVAHREVSEISVAKRDVAIFHFIKQKAFDLILTIIIFIVAVVLLVLAIVQKMSLKKIGGVEYLGIYLLFMSIYYLIETKIPELFYGNQTLYSNLIFIILMTAPLFMEIYWYESVPEVRKPIFVIMHISTVNVIIQLILQISGYVDFMDMSFISHAIIAVLILVNVVVLGKNATKEKTLETGMQLFGISCMMFGAMIDLLRIYRKHL